MTISKDHSPTLDLISDEGMDIEAVFQGTPYYDLWEAHPLHDYLGKQFAWCVEKQFISHWAFLAREGDEMKSVIARVQKFPKSKWQTALITNTQGKYKGTPLLLDQEMEHETYADALQWLIDNKYTQPAF